jgi:hypothetical protein
VTSVRSVARDHPLAVPADTAMFSLAELAECDEPVRRYFRAAVASGTELVRAARLRIRGSIRLGKPGPAMVARP